MSERKLRPQQGTVPSFKLKGMGRHADDGFSFLPPVKPGDGGRDHPRRRQEAPARERLQPPHAGLCWLLLFRGLVDGFELEGDRLNTGADGGI